MTLVGIRQTEDGVPEDEENFEEAIKAVNTALNELSVSPSLQEIFDHTLTNNLNSEVTAYLRVLSSSRSSTITQAVANVVMATQLVVTSFDSNYFVRQDSVHSQKVDLAFGICR